MCFVLILQNGHTALMFASRNGFTATVQATVQALIEEKADVNLQDKVWGDTTST